MPGARFEVSHPATERGDAGGAAGADQIVADGNQLQQLAAGFLLGFAPRYFLGGFGGVVHDAGDDLQQPRAARKLQRADPELLQQNHSISIRVEQRDRNRVAALQTFAGDFGLQPPANSSWRRRYCSMLKNRDSKGSCRGW